MLKKLRAKFITITMVLVCISLCVIFPMIYGSTANQLEKDASHTIHGLAGRQGSKRPEPQEDYLILRQTPAGEWSAQGSDTFDLTDQAYLAQLMAAADAHEEPEGVLEEEDLLFLRQHKNGGKQYIFLDISTQRTALRHLVRNLCIIGALSLLLFFGIILVLTNLALKPVAIAWQEQTQFIADASHELKTPLAVILTNAELLQSPDYTTEEQQGFVRNILTKAYQMRQLVEGLLELARLDNVSPQLQPLDVSALVEMVLLPFEPMFFENELTLESSIAPGLWVNGSEIHLQQVVEVFLDNALKYAAPGTVTVTVKPVGNYVQLQVENPGTPLSAEEAKKVFLRFYRADPARSQSGGYGLGLSIAHKILHEHSGKIWAEGTETGNRFSVLLPLTRSEH